MLTGASHERKDHVELNPAGRAILKAARFVPPAETPSDAYPFQLTTGRTAYHWHTRTKTGRVRRLNDAAPELWVELSPGDAEALGIEEGDLVRVESRRGQLEAPARISGIRSGVVFVPFHYGYWDTGTQRATLRAANELTLTAWDPVSKQPHSKLAPVRLVKVRSGSGRAAPAPVTTASEPVDGGTSGAGVGAAGRPAEGS